MKFNVGQIAINLKDEISPMGLGEGVRLTTKRENWFIPNQTIDETSEIITKNHKIVKNYFKGKNVKNITETDLDNFSLKIVLRYFQMYNQWRTTHKREMNRDLTFIHKDFEHPNTSDTIVDYFMSEYPDDFRVKCESILNMTSDQLREYLIRKEQFDNR
ncbi:MAG: hypothetical protein KA713_09550 [Chryseotalea sp. WA131a]|nr:MAG: hypothetical protein KA713_09550 [Chryseotalea sp. WA131a]